MKKLIALLLIAAMLLPLCACGKERRFSGQNFRDYPETEFVSERNNETEEMGGRWDEDPFLHPVDFYDRAYAERFFGDMGEWKAKDQFIIENYELNGQTGEFTLEYEGKNNDVLTIMYFIASFYNGQKSEPTIVERRNAKQYYNEVCSYYEDCFGPADLIHDKDSGDHENVTCWALESEVGTLYFKIEDQEERVMIFYDKMQVHDRTKF